MKVASLKINLGEINSLCRVRCKHFLLFVFALPILLRNGRKED